ncbi:hypothetical protein INR49_002307 [Caranx melampygus]|nr:hypothetical protein INR49_002307 [Caranx melampygus]
MPSPAQHGSTQPMAAAAVSYDRILSIENLSDVPNPWKGFSMNRCIVLALVVLLVTSGGFIGQRYTARSPLIHVPTLDVEVEQDGMVVGIGEGESTRATAVVDVGSVWTHQTPLQGDGEARQTADARPHWVTGVCSGGPQSRLQLVLTGHRLQGLQEKERTELALSWREHKICCLDT